LFKIEEGGFSDESFRENIRQQMSVQSMISEDIAAKVVVDDAAIEEFYNENIAEMAIPERVHARHILVGFDTTDTDARAAAEERLANIVSKLDAGESFALLAIEHSEGPSGEKGGDLGYFGRGQMVKSFEDVAFALEPGQVSGPLETQFGLHLIKVEDHIAAGVAQIADVEVKIREHLKQQLLYSAVDLLIEDLRANGDVGIHLW
jgi:peptidyl-prolyl cis-trans isomerase C